jgi:hypothetical protein
MSPSIAHRAATPATSVQSEQDLLSPSFSSSSFSYGSTLSKRMRLSSDSSSASEVATPETSSPPLPMAIQPSVLSMTSFDFSSSSTLNDLFYDSPAGTSEVKGLHVDFPSDGAYDPHNKDSLFDFEHSFSSNLSHVQS